MAAAGGDTVVPTNWAGLIMTALAVALVAAATYFGMGMMFGHTGGDESNKQETTLQDLYSSNAQRGIEAMETVRALPRSVLAPFESLPPPDAAQGDDVAVAEDGEDASADAMTDGEPAEAADETPVAAAPTPEPRPAPEPEPEPAPVAEAEQPKNDYSEPEPTATDNRYRATAAALHAWWADDSADDSKLGIRFIGPMDANVASNGLAILFDSPVDPATAKSFIELRHSSGKIIDANWRSGQNPNLIFASGLNVGRYQVSLDGDLPARNGKTLGSQRSGVSFVN